MPKIVGLFDDPERLRILIKKAYPFPDQEKVIKYLERGTILVSSPGFEQDILEPEGGFIGFGHLLTDGEWIWPDTFAHYISKYHIQPPDDFLVRMEKYNWEPSKLSQPEIEQLDQRLLSSAPLNIDL